MDLKKAQETLKRYEEFINYTPKIHGVTQSSLNTWMDCEKKARYYFRGLKSVSQSSSSMPLTFGSMFHDYQDVILNLIKDNTITRPDMVANNIGQISATVKTQFKWDEAFREANSKGRDNINEATKFMEKLVPRYFDFYKDDFENFAYEGIEQEFNVNIHGIPMKGKRDGVIHVSDAINNRLGLYLLEHKTKSRFDTEALQKSLPYMYQVLVYAVTYELEHGEPLRGVCYNVVRKPGLRRKAHETLDTFINRCMEDIDKRPQYYFVRFWKDFKPSIIDDFAEMFSNQILKFKQWQAQSENLDVRNTSKCQALYGTCQYIDYCTSGERDMAGLEVKEKLFSELE